MSRDSTTVPVRSSAPKLEQLLLHLLTAALCRSLIRQHLAAAAERTSDVRVKPRVHAVNVEKVTTVWYHFNGFTFFEFTQADDAILDPVLR